MDDKDQLAGCSHRSVRDRKALPCSEATVSNAFIDKLKGYSALSVDDVRLLEAACGKPREIPARQDLIREGDKPGPIFVILRGWACRYKLRPEGTRQITAFLMPGDSCEMHAS